MNISKELDAISQILSHGNLVSSVRDTVHKLNLDAIVTASMNDVLVKSKDDLDLLSRRLQADMSDVLLKKIGKDKLLVKVGRRVKTLKSLRGGL